MNEKIYLWRETSKLRPPEEYLPFAREISSYENIPDASVKDLFVEGTYLAEEELEKVIKKVRHGGVIKLSGLDLHELSRNVINGYMDGSVIRMLINHDEKLYSAYELILLLKKHKFKILSSRIANARFLISGKRE